MHARTMAVSVAVGSASVAVALIASVTPALAGVAVPAAHAYTNTLCGVTNDVPALTWGGNGWYRYTCHSARAPWSFVRR